MDDAATLPAPPVPADCNLIDRRWFPLDARQLLISDLMDADPEIFRLAVISWCVSWHQVPASSLPDDDKPLARLMGFGQDVRRWKKMREDGALRGWKKHSDGRLYHPVVSKNAAEAWKMKGDAQAEREAERKRLADWRAKQKQDQEAERKRMEAESQRLANEREAELKRVQNQSATPSYAANHTTPDSTKPNQTIQDHTVPLESREEEKDKAPSPSPGSKSKRPAATAAKVKKSFIVQPDVTQVARAIHENDLPELLRAMGCSDTPEAWQRDAVGLKIGELAIILLWCADDEKRGALIWPSGLRNARKDWAFLDETKKKAVLDFWKPRLLQP